MPAIYDNERVNNCLVGFHDAFNTITISVHAKGVYRLQTVVPSGNHKTKSAVLFRLLAQTKERHTRKEIGLSEQSDQYIKRKSGKGW